MKLFVRTCVLALCVFIGVLVSFSQGDLDTVTFSGRITDSNGLAVVGATVTATLVDTGEAHTVAANDDGRYKFAGLKPGRYTIKATAKGFGITTTEPIVTVAAQNLLQDLKLNPADVKAETTVTVTDQDGPVVDTTRTVVGGTITQREVEEIPNVSRNPLDLVLTLGGTSEEQLSVNGLAEDRNQTSSSPPLEQGNYAISGGVAYSNNLTIDGFDNNDDRSSRDRFQPSLEGISEVQVIQNQFSAEYGRASGGRINISTRAGSNKYRGRAFMFYRNSSFDANSWYNNSRGLPRQTLKDYDPGFFLSGPILRKKTFFSIAYEHDQLLDTTFIDTWVPTGTNSHWTLPAASVTTCPSYVPAARGCTDSTSPLFGGNAGDSNAIFPFQAVVPTPNRNDAFTARIDHNFSTSNNFTFGYQFGRKKNQRTTGASTTRLDDALQVRNSNTEAYNFTDNFFMGHFVNQARAQWSVFDPSFQTDNTPTGPVVLIGYNNPVTSSSETLITGNSTSAISGDATGFPQNRHETRIQVQDNLTYLVGNHRIMMGSDIMKVRSKALSLGDATGTYNFTGIKDFEGNTLSRFRQNFGTASDVVNTYKAGFFNDEIKVRPNITVSYGIRYERETAVKDNNNFGPRLGIAWDPFKKGKGVIRFGAGRFFNRVLLRTVADSIQNTGGNQVSFDSNLIGTSATDNRRTAILAAIAGGHFPTAFNSVADIQQMLATVCPTVAAPLAPCTTATGFLSSVTSTGNPLRTVDPNLKIPESYQFNIGFEREILKGWSLEINVTKNKTVHLWRDRNGNVPVLPAGYADWTAWLITHPYQLSPTRMYTFFVGSTTDTSGLHIGSAAGATPCTTTTANCFVNLNTLNFSTTAPAVSQSGVNGNSTGGPVGIARAAIAQFRRNPAVGETSVIGSGGNAWYRGLVVQLRSRYKKWGHGFAGSFRLAYTWSKTMDDGLNNTANAQVNGDFPDEFARSLQDRR
ncbi:MAG: TonB-dependent receptor, partial [Acidobacteria bacterium]|nr:TonB-dependent receptor [Acidobacteriota bacterium]